MQFSFTTSNSAVYYGLEPTIPEQIHAVAAAGYDFISPDMWSLKAHEENGTSVSDIALLLDQEGIACFELMALMLSPSREKTQENLDTVLRYAEAFTPSFIIVSAFEPIDPAAIDNLFNSVTALSEHGYKSAIEFVPYSSLETLSQARSVCEQVLPADLKIVVDCWHFFRSDTSWTDLEELPLDMLGYIHFDDAEPLGPEGMADNSRNHRCVPGTGEFDLTRFRDCIVDKGYEGVVSVEVLSEAWRSRPIGEFTEATLAATRSYWEKSSD